MKTFKIGYIKTELNDKGDRSEKYLEAEIEAHKIEVDSNNHLRLADDDNETIGYFNRNIWLKVLKKK